MLLPPSCEWESVWSTGESRSVVMIRAGGDVIVVIRSLEGVYGRMEQVARRVMDGWNGFMSETYMWSIGRDVQGDAQGDWMILSALWGRVTFRVRRPLKRGGGPAVMRSYTNG